MLKYFKKNKGFTLIELLVVIAIIAVLASIVLVSLNSARVKGRDARRIADLKSLQVALEMYYDKEGKYPTPSGDTTTAADTAILLLKTGGYIGGIPTDPKDNSAYKYATDSTSLATKYHLAAVLETAGHSVIATDADRNVGADVGYTILGDMVGCAGVIGETNSIGTCYDLIP